MTRETFNRAAINPSLPEGRSKMQLTVWQPAQTDWAVLVLPGGGYEEIASDREGFPVAQAFCAEGHGAAVLEYSITPDRWPLALLETAASIALLRERGAKRVAVCGFSAGGHLAGCAANLWSMPTVASALGIDPAAARPDAAILCYPVITAKPLAGRVESFDNLLGQGAPIHETLSLETSVRGDNPPTFLWATIADDSVPVKHTLLYADALHAAGVPFELHLYPNGPHAMALADGRTGGYPEQQDPHVATWFPLCLSWLNTLQP